MSTPSLKQSSLPQSLQSQQPLSSDKQHSHDATAASPRTIQRQGYVIHADPPLQNPFSTVVMVQECGRNSIPLGSCTEAAPDPHTLMHFASWVHCIYELDCVRQEPKLFFKKMSQIFRSLKLHFVVPQRGKYTNMLSDLNSGWILTLGLTIFEIICILFIPFMDSIRRLHTLHLSNFFPFLYQHNTTSGSDLIVQYREFYANTTYHFRKI